MRHIMLFVVIVAAIWFAVAVSPAALQAQLTHFYQGAIVRFEHANWDFGGGWPPLLFVFGLVVLRCWREAAAEERAERGDLQ